MDKTINAILLHEKDNVATAKETLSSGSIAVFEKQGETFNVPVEENIPKFHKLALVDIQTDDPVYKYGQLIGRATRTIYKGQHVHDHNVASPKKDHYSGTP